MDSGILVFVVVALAVGSGLTLYALMKVSTALKKAEQDRLSRAETENAVVEIKLRDFAAAQSEIAGRMSQLGSHIEALDQRLGESLKDTASKTAEALGGLQARLTVIDAAQKNLTDLSGQVVSLQQILANKQARGAWGQGQMEAIIRDALPANLYEFQARLSNNCRPDCLIRLPGSSGAIVIDAKFPLEAFEGLKGAASDSEKRSAEARVRGDVGKHIRDIAEKYLIAGETQAPAIMFVPSESLYAELHDGFADVIQKAQRAQVIVVSPNILLLAINTVQTVMKDARMREQANLIQREVGLLLKDVNRLTERVDNLKRHFAQADGDLKDIVISAGKVSERADKIEKVELQQPEAVPLPPAAKSAQRDPALH
jgi:DNA recombination protein RmuC